MTYAAVLAQYQGTQTVNQLRTHLLAKVWPGNPPNLSIQPDAQMATPGAVSAQYDSNSHTIKVRHEAHATDKDILDNVLWEVCNALNPKIAQAAALPKTEPVGNVGAANCAAEYDTMKAYVQDLATIFAGGAVAGFPNLVAGQHDLPTMALRQINTWLATYQPIYAAFNVPAGQVFAPVALNALLPLPAVVPVPAGAGAAPVPAEQVAVIQFGTTMHNPGADQTREDWYLAHLTSQQLYAYERVRGWTPLDLANYLKAIPGFNAVVPNLTTNAIYSRYRGIWMKADTDRRYRCYLFMEMVDALNHSHGGLVPPLYALDPAVAPVARREAARGVVSRYQLRDMTRLVPLRDWLASDVALLHQANVELGALTPGATVNLATIK